MSRRSRAIKNANELARLTADQPKPCRHRISGGGGGGVMFTEMREAFPPEARDKPSRVTTTDAAQWDADNDRKHAAVILAAGSNRASTRPMAAVKTYSPATKMTPKRRGALKGVATDHNIKRTTNYVRPTRVIEGF